MIKIFVINLEESEYRRKFMINQLKRVGFPFQVVCAVRSSEIEDEFVEEVNRKDIRCGPMTKGEIACVLSHAKACEAIKKDKNCSLGVILEDDVIFKNGILNVLNSLKANHPVDQVTLLCLTAISEVHLTRAAKLNDLYCLMTTEPLSRVWGARAYILSPKQGEVLASEMRSMRCRADDWHSYVCSGSIRNVMSVFPLPTVHAEFESDIGLYKNPESPLLSRKFISRFIHRKKLFPLYHIALHCRRRREERRQKKVIFVENEMCKKTYKL